MTDRRYDGGAGQDPPGPGSGTGSWDAPYDQSYSPTDYGPPGYASTDYGPPEYGPHAPPPGYPMPAYGGPAQYGPEAYGPPGYPPAAHPPPAPIPERSAGSSPMWALVGVLGTVLAVFIGVVVWVTVFRDRGVGAAAGSDTVTVTRTTSRAPTSTGSSGTARTGVTRPTDGRPPGGSTPVDTSRPNGNLDNVWVGPNTSEQFARGIRDQVRDSWRRTGRIPAEVSQFSEISGRTFHVTCQDQTMFVSCGGGTTSPPASVYIL